MGTLASGNWIERRIYLLRGLKIMLSVDLAELYAVEPRALIQAVKRNAERFPADFMFQLNDAERANLKSQSVISSWGGARANPYAFTEQGVAMLSTVLRSGRAIRINIEIMRAFVRLRGMVIENTALARKLKNLERKVRDHEIDIGQLFDLMQRWTERPPESTRRIGFQPNTS